MGKRIVFTGGSGKAGKYSVAHLVAKGHSVLNIDMKPLDHPGVHTLITDLTDSGQAMNALTSHFGYADFEKGKPASPPDAVVHFAAVPSSLLRPDNHTYQSNVMSTYNVLEAAMNLACAR
jgi:nucleoside-diphosphate-sugar epimerase